MTTTTLGYDELIRIGKKGKWDLLGPYLKKYGTGCMSYSTMQDRFEYFVYEDVGYIGYLNFKHPVFAKDGKKVVLANPIADVKDYKKITEEFLKQSKDVIFLEINSEFAKVLNDLGLQVNRFGVRMEIDVPSFDLSGKKRFRLRRYKNKCIREGVRIEEKGIESVDLNEVKSLSDDWIKRRGGHSFAILARKMVYENEEDVRYFWVRQNGKLIGFNIFDPMYKDGKIIGYYCNFARFLETALDECSGYALVGAIEKFKGEGIQVVSLGISSLSGLGTEEFNNNKVMSKILKFMYTYCEFIFPFKGTELYKRKYCGDERASYFSCSRGNNIFSVLSAMKAMKVF